MIINHNQATAITGPSVIGPSRVLQGKIGSQVMHGVMESHKRDDDTFSSNVQRLALLFKGV